MSQLRVGNLTLPPEAAEDVIAIVGRRGRGKTNTAVVLVEELHRARHRFCIADPVGVWWGLRSSRDGKAAGIPVVVMGGEHADVPLEETAGRVIADFVVDPESPSVVLDFRAFRKGQMGRFMTDFLEQLYHQNRHALHLVLDEADQFAPQRVMGDNARLVGAAEDVCKMGRARGLHPVVITQRPAALNKNVLTQAGLLIAHQLTGPQDQKAVDEWIRSNADEAQRDKFMATIASLAKGEAWFWQPELDIFRQVLVRARQTFDSSATPKAGERKAQPKVLADVDLEGLKTRIADTIARAKADDPKELRKRIAELERQLKASATAAPAPRVNEKRVEVPVLKDKDTRRLAAVAKILQRRTMHAVLAAQSAGDAAKAMQEAAQVVRSVQEDLVAKLAVLLPAAKLHRGLSTPVTPRAAAPAANHGAGRAPSTLPASPPRSSSSGHHGDPAVGQGGLRRILVALADRPNGLSARQVGVRARLSSKSGTFDTYLARARSAGWVEGAREHLRLTPAGLAALGSYTPPPTGQALLEQWLGELGGSGAGRMLRALAEVYPQTLSRALLAEGAGLTGNSGTFDTYLARLRSLELVEGKAELRASAELFE